MTARREALQAKLIAAAEKRLQAGGLSKLRARDITSDAGCALGSLYNAFGDLDELVLRINARTLVRLSDVITAASDGLTPKKALLAIAQAYARFASENRTLWDALFDHQMQHGSPTPDWFREYQSRLLTPVITGLSAWQPDLPEDILKLRASTYFSAIHGVVAISLQGRFLGVPSDQLHTEIGRLVSSILAGGEHISEQGPAA